MKKKEELKKMKEKRDKEELEKFEMAKNYKPSYISKYNELINTENDKIKEKEQMKKDEIMALKELRVDFGKKVRANRQPNINEILKKERMDNILLIENPKLVQIKDTFNQKLKKKKYKKLVLKKRDPTKPSKYPWLEKSLEKFKDLNNSAILENKLNKRPNSFRFSSSYSAKKKNNMDDDKNNKDKKKKKENEEKEPIIIKDYLRELREKRFNQKDKNENNEINEIDEIKKRKLKWEKDFKKTKGNIMDKIYNIKQEGENYRKKAEMEKQFLKLNGGVENNPEVSKKLGGYLIGSIEAKLSILNEMYK